MAAVTTLEGLSRELAAAAQIAPILVRPAVEASTKQVLASWRDSYRTIKSKPKIHAALGSNVWGAGGVLIGEVGINKNRKGTAGSFAHILEFGSVNNAARNDGGQALLKAAPGFYAAVSAATAGLMGGKVPPPVMGSATPARFNWDPEAPGGAT